MEFVRPRGTRDFLFEEMRQRKEVENTLRKVFENYGFGEVQTPLFEDLNLFTTKSGEEIVDQLYNFTDKGGRELTLRPEITAPIARLYLNEMQKTAKPIKLYYYGSCFRYERPQKGRFRQFWQFGCELIGAKSPEGEAEVIAMCSNAIEELGITTAEFNVNHLGIIRGLFAHFNIDEQTQRKIMIVIDKGDKKLLEESLIGDDPVIKDNPEINEVLFKLMDMVGDSSIIKDIRELVSPYEEAHEALAEFEELIKTLESYQVFNYKLNLGVARGLDYYTGIVFEVYVQGLGAQKQVCGGGTYSLIKLFGGEEVVSTGFALGFDRLINAIEELTGKKELEPRITAYVAAISESTRGKAFEITQKLRLSDIPTDVDLSRKKFKKLLAYADKIGVKFTVLVGERDLEDNKVTIKNMETGEQELVAIDDVADYIKKEI
ncbi:MAG: histidine--tRNA ligase [archaeon]|nr:histidine--tRNA ligase [archaeon]